MSVDPRHPDYRKGDWSNSRTTNGYRSASASQSSYRDPRAFDNYQPGSPLTANMRQRTPTYADYRRLQPRTPNFIDGHPRTPTYQRHIASAYTRDSPSNQRHEMYADQSDSQRERVHQPDEGASEEWRSSVAREYQELQEMRGQHRGGDMRDLLNFEEKSDPVEDGMGAAEREYYRKLKARKSVLQRRPNPLTDTRPAEEEKAARRTAEGSMHKNAGSFNLLTGEENGRGPPVSTGVKILQPPTASIQDPPFAVESARLVGVPMAWHEEALHPEPNASHPPWGLPGDAMEADSFKLRGGKRLHMERGTSKGLVPEEQTPRAVRRPVQHKEGRMQDLIRDLQVEDLDKHAAEYPPTSATNANAIAVDPRFDPRYANKPTPNPSPIPTDEHLEMVGEEPPRPPRTERYMDPAHMIQRNMAGMQMGQKFGQNNALKRFKRPAPAPSMERRVGNAAGTYSASIDTARSSTAHSATQSARNFTTRTTSTAYAPPSQTSSGDYGSARALQQYTARTTSTAQGSTARTNNTTARSGSTTARSSAHPTISTRPW